MPRQARPTLRCAREDLALAALVRNSLLDGHEHETHVAIRIIGSVPRRLVATILSLVPGCELTAWMSDYAMPERAVAPEEQIWSNIMDPTARRSAADLDAQICPIGVPETKQPFSISCSRTAVDLPCLSGAKGI